MNALVSIIMPAYNVEAYIEESIQSIINQEYKNWELIVVNDGSTDDTREVVQAITLKDSRVKLYNQKNSGVSVARNQGISISSGKYLAFLDGDDLWEPQFLVELVSTKETYDVDMTFAGYKRMYESGRCKNFKFEYADGDILLAYLSGIVGIHIGSLMIDKNLINKHNIRFTDGCAMGEDMEFIMKILCVAKVQAVRKELMLYRIRRPGSACNSAFNWRNNEHVLGVSKRAQQFIKAKCLDSLACKEAVDILDKRIGHDRCRLLWKMLKYGYQDDILRMLTQLECIEDLEKLDESELSVKKRLQYRILMSKNRLLWRFI